MTKYIAIVAILLCCSSTLAQAAEPDDFWRDFRKRQHDDFAALPRYYWTPGEGTPLNRLLDVYWTARKFTVPAIVDDHTFLRRVTLDLIGLPPTEAQLDAFERDTAINKREKIVEALLADQTAFVEHWMSFWNDLLRNDEQTNIDGLRKPITGWLYASLMKNKPLDQMTAELLNPGKDGPDGYLKGVNWRGHVNASQMPPIQAAQNVSQVFLASSIKCASCHDSFINNWKLAQAYGMASFFSPTNLEMHRCDKPTGKIVPPKFMLPDLGDVPVDADQAARHRAIATMVTRPKNPRFAKTMVNRLWKRLLGRGLFEPMDDFDDSKCSSPAILDWLAYDFMAHDYDMKYMLKQIVLSRVYQLPTVADKPAKGKETPLLAGPVERRLTSEQFLDAVAQTTGYWPKVAVMNLRVENLNIRAWRHKKPDALNTALGRPNREQVCTVRNEESTVLQALELVKGTELTTRLQGGAQALLASELGREADADKVIRTLYRRALGRLPNDEELLLARPLIGTNKDDAAKRQSGWEDFLWILCMSPEFQFIR